MSGFVFFSFLKVKHI